MLALMASLNTWAKDLKITVDPMRPVYKQPYEITFQVKVDGDEVPQIRFNPINIEVINKRQAGTQTQATFINGQASINKTITYIYEVVSNRFGSAYLKDIGVSVGDRELLHPTVRISILERPKAAKNIFVKAIVDKTEAFVGESILVRYFLYTRADIAVSSTDIQKFPKLNKFLKRFHQEQIVPERVRHNNQMFVRRVMYTAQLFAETPGDYTIDPISLRVGYSNNRDPFSNFGFNIRMGGRKKTTAISDPISIEVSPIPGLNIPKNFTGLVGQHNFKLKINKNKFLVNEPIEIQLQVDGNGSLELFDAPSVLNQPEIEEFDKKTDLSIRKDFTATKKVDFTYLGRSNLDLKNLNLKYSFFEPETKQFKEVTLRIGDILISGGTGGLETELRQELQPQIKPSGNKKQEPKNTEFDLNPFYKPLNTLLYSARQVSIALGSVACVFIFFLLKRLYFLFRKRGENSGLFERACRHGVAYKDFVEILTFLVNEGDLREKIQNLDISDKNKSYLLGLLDQLNSYYADGEGNKKIKVKKKIFKTLEKLAYKDDKIIYEIK